MRYKLNAIERPGQNFYCRGGLIIPRGRDSAMIVEVLPDLPPGQEEDPAKIVKHSAFGRGGLLAEDGTPQVRMTAFQVIRNDGYVTAVSLDGDSSGPGGGVEAAALRRELAEEKKKRTTAEGALFDCTSQLEKVEADLSAALDRLASAEAAGADAKRDAEKARAQLADEQKARADLAAAHAALESMLSAATAPPAPAADAPAPAANVTKKKNSER